MVEQVDRVAAERWGTGPVYNMTHLAAAFARHRTKATAALEERVKLLEVVAGYARHNGLCGIIGGYDVCTCGLDAAREALNDPR